jgi:hypothetical protein
MTGHGNLRDKYIAGIRSRINKPSPEERTTTCQQLTVFGREEHGFASSSNSSKTKGIPSDQLHLYSLNNTNTTSTTFRSDRTAPVPNPDTNGSSGLPIVSIHLSKTM